jgi:hypothetical protein
VIGSHRKRGCSCCCGSLFERQKVTKKKKTKRMLPSKECAPPLPRAFDATPGLTPGSPVRRVETGGQISGNLPALLRPLRGRASNERKPFFFFFKPKKQHPKQSKTYLPRL